MNKNTSKTYYHWLIQCDKDSNEINLKYYNRRDFNGIIIDTVFDLGVCLTEVYHNKEDLQNRLQTIPMRMIRFIDEDAPIFSIVYTTKSDINQDMMLGQIQNVIITNNLNVVYHLEI